MFRLKLSVRTENLRNIAAVGTVPNGVALSLPHWLYQAHYHLVVRQETAFRFANRGPWSDEGERGYF